MSSKTDYFENKLTDVLWRNGSLAVGGATLSWSGAPTFYVGLLSGAPSDSSGGTELTGTGYGRVALAASTTNLAGTQSAGSTAASSGTGATTSNNSAVTFARPDTTANWGTVTHFGIYDASSGGNLLEYAALSASVAIGSGVSSVQFAAGALQITEDN